MNSLSQLVLRTNNLEPLRDFYEKLLAISFTPEQHDDGPRHYSCQLGDVLLELYPTKQKENTAQKGARDRLGFAIKNLDDLFDRIDWKYVKTDVFETENGRAMELSDPDGRRVYVEEKKRI